MLGSSMRLILAVVIAVSISACAKSGGGANILPQVPFQSSVAPASFPVQPNLSRNALGICAGVAILAACNGGRTATPLLPAAGSLLRSNGGSTENGTTCPTILVISPAATISDVGVRHLALTETLEKRELNRYWNVCIVESKSHPPAKWSTTGGSLHVERGGTRAIFSGARFGIYGISATYSVYGASAVVLIQQDNKEQLRARLSYEQANGALLVDTSGTLYGVTANEPASVFELVRGASKAETLYTFQGYNPYGPLVADKLGDLFGTALRLQPGAGMAYELIRSGSDYTERILHRFAGSCGPTTGLVADHSGALYGTTDDGIVFKLTPAGGSYAYAVLHRFKIHYRYCILNNLSRLVVRGDGSLYGTVDGPGYGFVYDLRPKGSSYVERTLYDFKGGADGSNPLGGIVVDGKGVVYGTTIGGGTIFELTPNGNGFTEHILHRFDGLHGAVPTGLTSGANGGLYGVTNSGGTGYGTVFAFDRVTQKESTLYFFEGKEAGFGRPYFSPVAGATGTLYGVIFTGRTDSVVYSVKQ